MDTRAPSPPFVPPYQGNNFLLQVDNFKDPLTLTAMQSALFILIRPDMGRDLSRGKITAPHFQEEKNTEFEMSVVSNFLVSTSSLVRYQKLVKYFCRICFGPLNPPSCSNRRGHFLRLQKSHLKEKIITPRRRKIVPTFTESLRSMQTKLKPPASLEVFCIKNTLPVGSFRCVASNLHRA